jgi:hypothetical protein
MLQNTWKWKHCMKQVAWALNVTQWKHHKNCMKICKDKGTRYHPKILMENLNHKWLNKWCGFHWCNQNTKIRVESKKARRMWYKVVWPLKRQTTHFVGCTKRPNVNNFSCNCKNAKIAFDMKPNICVLFAKEGKTQVGWVVV